MCSIFVSIISYCLSPFSSYTNTKKIKEGFPILHIPIFYAFLSCVTKEHAGFLCETQICQVTYT